MARRRLSGQQGREGFTHLEVLVAMLLVGLVTPILVGSLMGSMRHARRAQISSVASAWLAGEVDYLRARCYQHLAPSTRKVTQSTLQAGEPALPDGFGAALITLEREGHARYKATLSLHRTDWTGPGPPEPPALATVTYVGDLRVAGACP